MWSRQVLFVDDDVLLSPYAPDLFSQARGLRHMNASDRKLAPSLVLGTRREDTTDLECSEFVPVARCRARRLAPSSRHTTPKVFAV